MIKKEFLAMLGARYYTGMLQDIDNPGLSPAVVEYVAQVCISTKTKNSVRVDISSFERIMSLCEQLASKQMIINMYSGVKEEQDDVTISKSLFSGEMRNIYSFIRGYSWYRKIEEDNIKGIFDGFDNKIVQELGFRPLDVYVVTDAYADIVFDRLRRAILSIIRNIKDKSGENDFFSIVSNESYKLMAVSRDELYEKCNSVSREHFDALIDFFRCNLNEEINNTIRYFTDDNYFSMHPIIDDGMNMIRNSKLNSWKGKRVN
ncbi:MAG: hypothetical protein K6B68_11060 [Eubacterium sp.]|nr:hypothetical protein [Eubacterium sp.]